MKLNLPIFGPIMKKMIMTRFYKLFRNHVPLRALPLWIVSSQGESIVGNTAVAAAVGEAGRMIGEGEGISAAFAQTGLFPPLVLRMLRGWGKYGDT